MNKLSKKNIEDILALTPMQEGMLFFHLKDPANGAYFEQLSLEVTGEIDTRTFEEAWNVVIKSNEMLRTFFRWEKMEKQVQIVLKEHRIQPTYYDFTPHPPEKKKKQLDDLRAKDREDGFNLGEVPFRISLAKIEKEKSVFIISNSHILYDGWSNGILLKEFFNVYSEISTGRPPEVQCKTKFKEFIKWNRDRDKGNEKRYWQEYLREYETQTGLSIKKVEKNNGTANGDKYRATTHKALAGQLERYAAKHKITPASVMYTAWGILLQKYNNSEQALFGTTVSGRNAKVKGIEDIVGLFINTLPLILKKTPGEKITAIVHRIDETLKKREQFEHTSLIDIKEYNKIENIEELFDTIVVIENYPLDKQLGKKAGNLSLQGFSMEEKSHYDLTVGITWFDGIEINFVYNSDKLEKGRVVKLAQHFKNILGEIITKTGEEDSSIEMITPAEKKQVLYEFNETTVEYPQDKNIRQLFQRQAEETPTGIAVVGPVQDMSSPGADGREPATVTYRQLNEQSSHLAHILQEKGVKPGAIVAIMAQRNVEMITALLGILEADAVYLPIDPDYPQERIDYLLKDSNATLLLTTHQLHKKTTLDKEVIYLNEIRNSASATRPPAPGSPHPASRPAYVIYTSGTTGKPKGVLVGHEGVVNLINYHRGIHHEGPRTRMSQVASPAFDAMAFEIWPCLTAGGTLYIADNETRIDVTKMKRWLIENKIEITFQPTPMAEYLLKEQWPQKGTPLRILRAAGDRLTTRPGDTCPFKVYNLYGPTEDTVWTTWAEVQQRTADNTEKYPDIGKPIANHKVYILGPYSELQPPGIAGELCITGIGLAKGYLNRPQLTAEKFRELPASVITVTSATPVTIYRTGDLARWQQDGTIEFLGRIDHQVKIRGYRIELGEIEKQLLQHFKVEEAVVTANTDETGDKYLCAYIVAPPQQGATRKHRIDSSEIGCASGITMFRIAPQVKLYYGTDLSSVIIEKDKQRAEEENHKNIKLACLKAHEIDQIEEKEFDLIIINSVIHCFHGHNYLRKVIKKCVHLLADKGNLFIGDIMDQDRKHILEKDMKNFKNTNAGKGYTTKTDFSAELFISRGYWQDTAADIQVIEDIRFSRKIHTVENELTRYRYDAQITLNKKDAPHTKWRKSKHRDHLGTLTEFEHTPPIAPADGSEEKGTGPGPWQPGKPVATVAPHQPAYIIYTSGTTGKPKGVIVEHRGVVDYITWAVKTYVGDENVNFPLFTSITFDLTVTSLFTPLLSGNAVVVYSEEGSGFILDRVIEENKVGVIKLTPSHLKMIREKIIDTTTTTIKRFIVGGEELETSLAAGITANFAGKIGIYNEYGPTETVVGSMIHRYEPGKDSDRTVSIGKPSDNTQIYVLDGDGKLVPPGVKGEICISGVGMARGYMSRPELTAERFTQPGKQGKKSGQLAVGSWQKEKEQKEIKDQIPNNQSPITNNHLYHTGDLGRWLSDGTMEYLGRIDDQVKIRGYRVEMGEIENRLTAYGEVKEAVVDARMRDGGEYYLCAYVVAVEGSGEGEESTLPNRLKDYLAQELPEYMVPAYIVEIDKIPLTPNGKIDRKALPEPGITVSDSYVAPRDGMEENLVKIWAQVLGIEKEKIGVRDTFFELGGNSLNLVRMVSVVSRELVTEVSVARVYQAPVIEEMAKDIMQKVGTYTEEEVLQLNKSAGEPFFFFPPGVAFGIVYNELAAVMPDYAVYAFNFIEEEDRLEKYVGHITGIQPEGPYRLFGWSAAGALVFEVAGALEKKGYEVSDIIMADTAWEGGEAKEFGDDDRAFIEGVEKALENIDAHHLKGKVNKKMEKYLRYKKKITHLETVQAKVHLILSRNEKEAEDIQEQIAGWRQFTQNPVQVHQGAGTHEEMFEAGAPLHENAKIIRKILKKN